MTLTIIRLLVLNFLLLIPVAHIAICKNEKNIKSENQKPLSKEMPVLRWTANRDAMNFRYDFLENVKTTMLYIGRPKTGTWNHHTMITYFKGVLYASWDQHVRDENASGQHGLLRRSSDMGKTWTEVEELFPPLSKKVPAADPYPYTRFQSNNGFANIEDILYAITDVAEWSAAGTSKIGPRKKIGRMARTINQDGTLGDIFWLLPKAPEPIPDFPTFPAGDPVLVNKINDWLLIIGNEPQLIFGVPDYPESDDGQGTGEPIAWQLDDGTWVKIFRDSGMKGSKTKQEDEESKSRRNYASFSFDNGKTWTLATKTSFPDACGRSTAGKLPDGQVYVINAAWPLSNKKGGRSLQAISLSGDGFNFDRMAVLQFIAPQKRYKGRSKAVGFQAHSVVAGDYLFVLSSVNKEDIQLKRIPVNELYKLK
jgi:hypothetical protein